MATVTGYTAARMKEIEDKAIIDGVVNNGNLILQRYDGTEINAGNVRGPQGIQGPIGEVEEAPVDTVGYVRKDGVWVPITSYLAPSDGKKYVMKDGAWVQVDRPWKMEFTNVGPSAPAGFSTGTLQSASDWSVKFSGFGNVVTYSFEFRIYTTQLTVDPRFTLPTSLRPITESATMSFMYDATNPEFVTGSSAAVVKTNGQVQTPVYEHGLMVQTGTPFEPNGALNSTPIGVRMGGSYIRQSSDLPSTAVYV